MALFGKKKKQNDDENPVVDNGGASSSKKSKKANRKKGGMAEVLNESVPATVEDELRSNQSFVHHVDGEEKYVGMLMHVSDIGGLDKKSRKTESKGSLIEAINSGNLKTVITPELLDNEEIVFIPDVKTVFNMLDFSLLEQSPETGETIKYDLVYVSVNSNTNRITITPLEPAVSVTFSEISNLIGEQEGTIDDLLMTDDEEVDAFTDSLESESEESLGGFDDGLDVEPDDSDDIPMYDGDELDDAADDIDDIDDIDDMGDSYGADVPYDGSSGYENDGYDTPADEDTYGQSEMPVEQEEEVPDEWMADVVTRRFYSDDLGLEITTEPFDAQFMQGNMFIPFDENRPSGWLNDQLNELSRQANVELERIHRENLFLMRERYFKLMSKHADRIQKDLDVTDDRTQYGKIMDSLRAARDAELSNVDAKVARKKDDMELAWKRKLQEVGQDAARAAQHQYRERYGKQHDADIYHLSDEIRSAIEDDYHDAVHEVNDRRRMEATKLLDLGITEVLEEVSDLYMSALADENAKYQELEESLRTFIDDNRRHDIAHTNTLAEQLRQKNAADEVLATQTAKIANLQTEFEAERATLQSEIDKIRKDNKIHIADMQSHADEALAREQRRNEELQRQMDALREQNEKIYKSARQEYAHQIEEKNDEIAALHSRFEEAADQQKRTNQFAAYLVMAITICAIGIGFIFGTYLRLGHEVKTQQSQMVQEYNQTQQNSDANTGK